ncbi:transcription factor bHLH128 [Pyrus ussuriensis x Pyrus communis]|uniref:Transcription factor bHLH128 n=1 Tax=Pyrus ussuriensis x Pyrus communis TaxID=2448454 RepID=A0A5N5FTB0_9ROSA|nr:transcription factor bHLH128 [Pyrus ussuriensis x Pyrus communis]
MYSSSSSSSPQNPIGSRPSTTGLARYGSAPSSLLNSAFDSVIETVTNFDFSFLRLQPLIGHYFSGDGHDNSFSFISSDSTFKVNSSNGAYRDTNTTKPLLRSYGLNEIGFSDSSSCSSSAMTLVRQQSSPAGFPSHLIDSQISCFWMASPFSEY